MPDSTNEPSTRHPQTQSSTHFLNLIPSTAGVKGIEAAYSRAGAHSTHTPGTGFVGAGTTDTEGKRTTLGSGERDGVREVARRVSESREKAKAANGGMMLGRKVDARDEPSVVGQMINSMLNGSGDKK